MSVITFCQNGNIAKLRLPTEPVSNTDAACALTGAQRSSASKAFRMIATHRMTRFGKGLLAPVWSGWYEIEVYSIVDSELLSSEFVKGWGMTEWRIDRRWRAAVLGIAVFLGVMALVVAIFLIGRSERAFELGRWENRLRAASAQRLVIVNQWLSESRSTMRSASVDPTVQMYLSELATANGTAQSVPYADTQLAFMSSYVANLGRSGPFAASAG